jgi:hypothetical protein
MSEDPVRCEECTKKNCEIRGVLNKALPCKDFEDWNIFNLYAYKATPEELKKAKQATLEFITAIDEAGTKIHDLCEKWRDVGADDTASQDEILHVLGRKVRGWDK